MNLQTLTSDRPVARPGLTLIETLVATVLLSVLAAAGVGLVREVRSALTPSAVPRVDIVRLGLLADASITDPNAIGRRQPIDHSSDGVALQWPAWLLASRDASPALPRPQSVVVSVLRAQAGSSKPDRAWIVFECEGVQTVRCVAIPPLTPGDHSP